MRRSGDIRERSEASAIGGKWRRRGRSQQDDHGLTFDPNEFGVREPNSAKIGVAVFEKRSNRRTHRQTDRQTPLLYIYRYQKLDGEPYRTTPISVVRLGLEASLRSAIN